jgi:sigma-E factor negative regulatory protein RseA
VTENMRESLSALIDGEASEIEVHKLLRHIKSIESDSAESGALHRSWASYQEIRGVVNSSSVDTALPVRTVRMAASRHLELRLSISNAIEAEDAHQLVGSASLIGRSSATSAIGQKNKSALARYRAPATGLAIAASLVVAIFVGLSSFDEGVDQSKSDIAQSSTSANTSSSPKASQPISTQTVSTQTTSSLAGNQNDFAPLSSDRNSLEQQLLSSGEDGMLVDQSELKELNEEQKQKMRAYLQLHDRMARSNLNHRTVNFDGTKK